MSSVYNQFGHQVPVTTVMAEPNIVFGIRDKKIILGLGKKKISKKTENTYLKIAGFPPRFIKEVTLKNETSKEQKTSEIPQENSQQNQEVAKKINLGDKITVSIFEPGDEVKVTGTTKGKGFTGVVKRWGFAGGPKTHGQSDRHRAPGSIGMGTTPGRVFKGKKMAGHLGNSKLTVTGLEVIEVNEDKNIILIKGAIPGPKDGFLIIEKTGKVKSYTLPPPSEEKQTAAEGLLHPLRHVAEGEPRQWRVEDEASGEASEPRPESWEKEAKADEKEETKGTKELKEKEENEDAKS
ncbi:50S ribosomal protein L3 [Candidatus Curtissbacteria bacterium RIFCSPLOWO2_02_FULL_40_11]|uniref:50S ribosomal protein L3 n=1 Tax=Candidatus Curtissbacteria bacterium RIFCSPLOWO2_12_FULL_38_9 TaxID=1797735 RepID=A0A1F5I8R9_9BACT|nr:MAG: 50S ribosomal protein L3 [Candidatus Curtissbacteria bacterium RIFCSPHIGHO2_01_FULL_39_57]OGD90583.1 MAG: 50S ribosomal protein L3 [Candidatus Curtissbacteria bacterium RIFCSPHIGHO2_12_FULL_38_37]OGD99800.1 MAG: 50S ribosomal protein L3 [Candidatus Curtissbacteria bacterium RIFCSPLOWO2_02_FULL_40_11]OGE12762.1 MAG: 50S ribosomal protein L3 [Candidatus Curtissbacteria bacterium RIFCSPLOWO2_12_FULL_38_9]